MKIKTKIKKILCLSIILYAIGTPFLAIQSFFALLGDITHLPPEITIQRKITTKTKVKTYTALVSMYNVGDPSQTDDSPCIGASNKDLCKLIKRGINVCASNYFSIGTKLNFNGLGVCVVEDRMNSRYSGGNTIYVDWALPKEFKNEAMKWGRREVEFFIINN